MGLWGGRTLEKRGRFEGVLDDSGRLGVFENLTLEIADDHALVVVLEYVFRINGNLAPAAWGVYHELGNAISGRVPPEALDDLNAFADRGAEMGRAFDEIHLIKVIGANATADEFMDEIGHCFQIVVYAAEEHTLVSEGHPVVREAFEGFLDLDGEFTGMVDMNTHPKGVVFLEHGAELRRDALWKKHGDAGAYAEKLDVFDAVKAGENFFEFSVAKEKRVAAGEEDIADFGVLLKILKSRFKIGFEILFTRTADDPASRAIAAIGCATIRDEEEDAIGITMDQAWDWHMRILSTGIAHFVFRPPRLFDAGHDLASDGAIGIGRMHQVHEMRSDGHCELIA